MVVGFRYIDMYPDVLDLERRNMSAMISALDVGIGATVDDLNSTGLWAHTLMTVCACELCGFRPPYH